MQFGEEMHDLAFRCVREKLGKLRPGGFSVEQRYRYDRATGITTLISPEQVQTLLRQGRGSELRGTLVPDVVLHDGNPLRVQEIYDFKFPCVNSDEEPSWSKYPPGHPYEEESQGAMYFEALRVEPARVVPRIGIIR